MKTRLFTILLLMAVVMTAEAQTSFGKAERIDNGWLFRLQDDSNAMNFDYDDSRWQRVVLPHDWGVTQPMSPDRGSCQGYLPGGIGWYRLHLRPDDVRLSEGQRLFIYFEGVYNRSSVYLNGQLLGYRPSGFASFLYDLTPHLHRDGSNVLAVRVDHSRQDDSRWYTGSGIYRPVWLVRSPDVHLALWGSAWRIRQLTASKAIVDVDVETTDETHSSTSSLTAMVEILDADGKVVASTRTPIKAQDRRTVSLTVKQPRRWSLTSPYLYKIVTRLQDDDRDTDRAEVPLGLRTLTFSPDKGFALNGEWMKVKGVCLHDDAGVLGTAVPKDVWQTRLVNLKSLGCNAIRMSHNPHAPALYELCDSLGLLVMDEASDEWEFPKRKWLKGWNQGTPGFEGTFDFFEEWIDRDVADMVRRDRCHPSVFLWSIGNEVDYPNDPYSHPVLNGDKDMTQPVYGGYKPEQPNAERIGTIAKRLSAVVRSIDSSRAVTGALAGVVMSNETAYPEAVDVVGYNYTESRYVEDHKKYPKRVIYGSENRHDLAAWQAVTENEHIFGQFLWTGIDYLGESGPWPARGSEAGLIDLAGFVKPNGWVRARMWGMDVADSLLSRQRPQTGRPYALRASFRQGMSSIAADHVAQVEIEVVDEQGRLVWLADNEISCRIQGRARLLGMENGDIRDTRVTSPLSGNWAATRCRVKNGRLIAYIDGHYVPMGNNQRNRNRRERFADDAAAPADGTVRVVFTSPLLERAEVVLTTE